MLDADFFRRFGLFVEKQFLDADLCARLRSEVAAANRFPATVREEGGDYAVDARRRSTAWAEVSPDANAIVQERLESVKPSLEEHYGVPLSGFQPLQFLVYGEGDFFAPHRDSSHDEEAAEFSRSRQVSCVIFLNGSADEPAEGSYGGGALTFYGLLDNDRGDPLALPLRSEEGLLATFPSETMHEVTPISHGERYTVVTWFV